MKDFSARAQAIAELRGQTATFWAYTVSHDTLTLRLKRPHQQGNTHIVCMGCYRIETVPHWGNSALELISLGEDRVALIDREAAVRIECSAVVLRTDVPPVY
jgi:hypothetical protein